MFLCHRGSKRSSPGPQEEGSAPYHLSSPCESISPSDSSNGNEWRLPSILTAGSLDELPNALPGVPVMPPVLEAQLAAATAAEAVSAEFANKKSVPQPFTDPDSLCPPESVKKAHSTRRPMLNSVSMHSLLNPVLDFTHVDQSRTNPSMEEVSFSDPLGFVNRKVNYYGISTDGSFSLPLASSGTRKKYQYSGMSLLSLGQRSTSTSRSTLKKLLSLDVDSFSSLMDFEERYTDPWVGSISLRRTVKPNLENERHRENSLFLSILEAKGLQNKRRYYCDVCLDRTLYARTTSKQAVDNSIFWAEEFDLNNLPEVSILTISLYRETEYTGRDGRRGIIVRSNSKKNLKKAQNRLVGFVTVPVGNLYSRNPSQTWLTLQPPSAGSMAIFHPHLNPPSEGSGPFLVDSTYLSSEVSGTSKGGALSSSDSRVNLQLRINARYKSVDVLPLSVYWPLHSLVLDSGIELAEWFEALLPVKLKEEVASCLVNLRERNATVATFLSALVVNEVSALENESMTFRSNTMATKAVESYIKLVGKEYLHGLLHRYIQRVLACSDTWEVDPDKLPASSLSSGSLLSADGQGTAPAAAAIIRDYCAHKTSPIRSSSAGGSGNNTLDTPQHSLAHLAVLNNGRLAQPGSLIFNQLKLLQHLDLVWETVRASRKDFPKQLLHVFSAFRAALQPSRGAEFCDKLVSACIFLRFICPAILTPSLFGLASTFPGESNCQRNLTLVAKSLQSLANLATFGDKEPFMRFMNAYVEAQIPVMREFLRDISSLDISAAASADCSSVSSLSNHIDCGYELACLHATCVEMFANLAAKDTKSEGRTQETGSSQTTSSTFPSVDPALTALPPKLSLLPDIVMHIEELKNGNDSADLTSTEPPPPGLGYEGRIGEPPVYAPVNPASRIPQGRVSTAYAEYPAAPVPPRKHQQQPSPKSTAIKSQHSATLPRFFLSPEEEENILNVAWAGNHGLDRSVTLEPRLTLGTESQPEKVSITKPTPVRSNEVVVGERRTTTSFSGSRGGQAASTPSGEHTESRSPEQKQPATPDVSAGTQPLPWASHGLHSQSKTSETTATSITVRDPVRVMTQEGGQQRIPAGCSGDERIVAAVHPSTTPTRTAIVCHPREEEDVEGDYDDPYCEEHESSQAVHLNGASADDGDLYPPTSSTIPKSDAVMRSGPSSSILRSPGSDAARHILSFPSPPSAFSLYRRPKPISSAPATTPTESSGIYKFVRTPVRQREITEEDLHLAHPTAPDATLASRDQKTRLETRPTLAASRGSATHSTVATLGNRDLDGRVGSTSAATSSTPRTSFPTTNRSLDVLMMQSSNSAVGSNPCAGSTVETLLSTCNQLRQHPSRSSTTTTTTSSSSSSGWSPIASGRQNSSPETSELSRSTLAHHYPYRQAVNAAISAAAFAASTDSQVFESPRVSKRSSQLSEPTAATGAAGGGRDGQSTADGRKNSITVMSTYGNYQPATGCSVVQRGDHSQARTTVETLVTLTSRQPQRRPQQLDVTSRALQEDANNSSSTTTAAATDNHEAKVRGVAPSRLGAAAASGRTAAAPGSTNKPAARQQNPRTVADRVQPLVENEKMLSSTLEELGDAVAWLERERNDLLQQERLSRTPSRSSCHRQQSNRGGAVGAVRSYGSPSKHQAPVTNTSVPSLNLACQAAEEPSLPRPQAHYAYQQYYSAGGMSGVLTKSTNSLSSVDPVLSPHTPPTTTTTTTFGGNTRTPYLLSRSGSGSASPHRSRHSSGSSDRSYLTARSSLISRGSIRGENSRPRANGGGIFTPQATATTTTTTTAVATTTTSFPRPSGLTVRGGRIESMEALYNSGGNSHRLQPRNASASRSNCSLYSDRTSNLLSCSLGRPSSDALSPRLLNREAHNFAVPSSPLTS